MSTKTASIPILSTTRKPALDKRRETQRLSNAGLRVIDKLGLDVVLADLAARGEKF